MDYQKQIDIILEQALTEKTFSFDVIGKIKELRDGFNNAEKEIEGYIKDKEERKIAYAKLAEEKRSILDENEKLVSTITEWKKREEELIKREKAISMLEVNLQNQRDRANEIKELFGWVIKGPMIVRTKTGNIPVPIAPNGGYVSQYPTTETVTEEAR